MELTNGIILDVVPLWTWALLFMRCLGMIEIVPAIGTSQIPRVFRVLLTFSLSVLILASGLRCALPTTLAHGLVLLVSEFLLGVALGLIPAIIINGVGVAGQVISGSIGLGQANMMDPSLGHTAILSRLQVMLATIVFLAIDGHHVVIKAVSGMIGNMPIGGFAPDFQTFYLLLYNLKSSFEFAIMLAAPMLVTALCVNFVLGLITKFVPQMNIFIISLPIGILVGLYLVAYTTGGLSYIFITTFNEMTYSIARLFVR